MKIYIAGSSKEAQYIAECIRKVKGAGHEVTFDWTVPVLAAVIPDHELTDEERWHHASTDAQGVDDADVFWMLIPSTPSLGAWVELGIAWRGSGKLVIVSGDRKKSIFTALSDEKYDTHEEALARILRQPVAA